MVPFLKEVFEKGKPAFMEYITKLNIRETRESWDSQDNSSSIMYWPLQNLDLHLLKSLLLRAIGTDSHFVRNVGELFAKGYFVNLKKLTLEYFQTFSKHILANVPSLESLTISYCGRPLSYFLRLEVPNNFSLKHLTISDYDNLKKFTPLLKKIKGLESLIIKFFQLINNDRTMKNLVRELVKKNKETLRKFKLKTYLCSVFDSSLWDIDVIEQLKLCHHLADLSIPLDSTEPSYYCDLIGSFPSLSNFTIYQGIAKWSPDRALEIFPASTNLESVLFKVITHDPGRDIWYRQRLIRKELKQQICSPSIF